MRLIALAMVFVSGCMPQPRSVRSDSSALEPIERLGRWDGDSFVAVAPSTVPPSHAHVLVHGWAPGWSRAARATPDLRAWEAVDARGRPFEPWMARMARAIVEADPHAVVLVYSWLDHSATSRSPLAQRNALARAEIHGDGLAAALEEAVDPSFFERQGRIHLIGHSYGALVATLAAVRMPKAPRQLTLFDVPDAPMTRITGGHASLALLLSRLPIGGETGQTFVDNYFSMIGERYGDTVPGVVDVALTPPYNLFDYRRRHLYGPWFYTQSAHHEFGMGWSPLIGRPPAPGCYEQPWGEIDLARGCDDMR
ncbi:MAG: hypothetical protein KF729_20500 [Sandaracinaceae bacterium]|nr:hypothetical protein [Sandaracinaceae bacterium]